MAGEAKDAAAKKEAEAKKAAERAACIKDKLAKLNPHDGLVHNQDGSKEFLDGGIVAGANSWISKNNSK